MNKLHIVFFVCPAHGHINPTLAVAERLIAAGHRVSYAMHSHYSKQLHAIGAKVVEYNFPLLLEGFSSQEDRNRKLESAGAELVRESLTTHAHFRDDPPDVVIRDYLDVGGAIFCKAARDVPVIKSYPGFAHNQAFPISLGGWDLRSGWIEEEKKRLDREFNVNGLGEYFFFKAADRNLVFIPKFFQCHGDSFDKSFFFVGPSISKRRFYGDWKPSLKNQRVVLVSLGTMLNGRVDFFQACIEAFRHESIHVVLTVGNFVDIDRLHSVPENVDVRRFVSHLDVLPHACLFIGQGGMNSTMEAIYNGVPVLLAPQDGQQKVIAERVGELGLGKCLSPPYTDPENLRAGYSEILRNKEVQRKARSVGEMVREASQIENTVKIVEDCYSNGMALRS